MDPKIKKNCSKAHKSYPNNTPTDTRSNKSVLMPEFTWKKLFRQEQKMNVITKKKVLQVLYGTAIICMAQ